MNKILYTLFLIGGVMLFANSLSAQLTGQAGVYTLTGTDSFGDGWNGSSVDIITAAGTTNFTILAGAGPESVTFTLAAGETACIQELTVPGGFVGEIGYTVTDPSGVVILAVAEGGGFTGTTKTIIMVETGCGVGECPLALNITAMDSFGDGWDGSTLDVTVNGVTTSVELLSQGLVNVPIENTVSIPVSCIAEDGSTVIDISFNDMTPFDGEVGWTIELLTTGIVTGDVDILTAAFGDFPGTNSGTGTITVTCPAVDAAMQAPTPTAVCGIYEIGKTDFVQAPSVITEDCANGFNCPAVGGDCSAIVPSASVMASTSGQVMLNGGIENFTASFPVPANADPLAGVEVLLCGEGDLSFNTEFFQWTFEDGTFAEVGEVGVDCGPRTCVTVCLPPNADFDGNGAVDFTVVKTAGINNFCPVNEWTADATFLFAPLDNAAAANPCVSWFLTETTAFPFFMGTTLTIGTIQDLIDSGVFDPSILCHEQVNTVFVEATCGELPSARVAVNIFTFDSCEEGCPQYVELADGGADGWEGASLTVSVNEGADQELKLTAAQGGCFVYQFCVEDGGSLDLQYWEGSDNDEHSFNVLGFDGEILLASGTTPSTDNMTVKASCPETACAGSLVDVTVRITLGGNPEENSWEIFDGFNNVNCQGPQVFGVTGNTYAGLAPGTQITTSLQLEACNEYTVALFDSRNNGWQGGTFELISSDIDYGNEITNPLDAFFGQSSVITGFTVPDDEERMAFTFPCKPECVDASDIAVLGDCVAVTTTLPIATPEICFPDCNHGLGCEIQFRHRLLADGNDGNVVAALTEAFAPINGQTEVDYTALLGFQMSAGCHSYVTEFLYCDGLITKCTSTYTVFVAETSNFSCNDNVTVGLTPPNNNPAEGGSPMAFFDDLGECVIQITADMVIEAGVPSTLACEFFNINDFYEVIILDANDQPLVVFDANGLPLNSNGGSISPAQNTVPANNFVSYNEIKQTLNYVVTHKVTGTSCWGTLTVEDKNAPTINCVDYDVNCNDPNALDEFFSETTTLQSSASSELPFNIAGGADAGAGLSNTWIPFSVPCGRLGTVLQNIQVNLNLTHNNVNDLSVQLHIPTDFNNSLAVPFPGAILQLDTQGDVGAVNTYTPNPMNDSPDLLGLLGSSCKLADSQKDVNFVSESTGAVLPEGHGKTWYLRVQDNADPFGAIPHGAGQVTAASLSLTCGFPFPYMAFDCALDNVELISEIVESNCDLIAEWNGAQVIRVWKATDACGNASTCTQTVNLKAPRIADLILPSNDIVVECGTEVLLADGITLDPAQSGSPAFCCDQVTDEDFCKLSITFEDNILESCGNSYKVIRTWQILNWCLPTTTPTEFTQLIVVGDNSGPTINVGAAITIDANDDCEGALDLSALDITDDCSAITGVRLEYTTGNVFLGTVETFIIDLFAGNTVSGLPLGTTNVTIIATDECFQVSEVEVAINVVDTAIPTAICDNGLNISLNSNGTARVLATDFDEGSNDNCSAVTVAIRSLGCVGAGFAESADFACCDLGTVRVELLVTDAEGNTNICWADLSVEDPIGPTIVCKPDVTVTCDEALHAGDLFTEAEGSDNCGVNITNGDIVEVDLPNCGQLLIRTSTASDGSDKTDDPSCTQTITVVHVSDFIVQFPADQLFTDCAMENIPGPIVSEDDCENIGISVEDRIFVQVADACYKIERTYTIINHCIVENPSVGGFTDLGTPLPIPRTFRDDDGFFQYTQIIKIQDSEAPSIAFTAPDPCDFTDGCEGEVILTATAEDACSDVAAVELTWQIDTFSDGTFDLDGTGADATGVYPYGDHIIKWTATDGCGNATAEEFEFSVLDCKNPTPKCQGLTTVVMNNGACVSIDASHLLESAFDNCTERTDEEWDANARVRLEGDNGALTTSIDVCCEDVQDGGVNVEVWIEDDAGNADFCIVFVEVQDNGGNCPTGGDGASALIAGKTATEFDNVVDGVEVSIDNDITMTDANGVYSSSENVNEMHTVTPEKLDGVAEGVSTFDLVLMAQHVLQINELTTPYQLIAGDVNNDLAIDIFDMVELRSLILFTITEFSNNTSWKFVDADYTFQNPTAPWAENYPESIDVPLATTNMVNEDFVAVKIGDLDGDAKKAFTTTADERSFPTTLTLNIDDVEMTAGNTYKVDFRASDFNDITGYQFTMNFDQNAADFISVEAGALNVDESNFGFTMLDEGIITTSFAEMGNGISVENEEVLFSINFTANANATLHNVLSLTNQYTLAEAYNTESEVSDVNIAFNNAGLITTSGSDFELFQNKPNPFSETTLIGFNLPAATTATLRVYDVSGKTLKVITANYARGFNQVNINRNELGAAGVLYYQLDTDSDSAVKKMIILE